MAAAMKGRMLTGRRDGAARPRCLCVGPILMDRLRFGTGGEETLCPGGNGVISSVVLAQRGIRATLLGQVGKDTYGDSIRRLLRSRDVDVSRLLVTSSARTKVAEIRILKDGTWLRRSAEPKLFPYLCEGNLKDESEIRGFCHLHVAGLQGLLRVAPDITLQIIQMCRDRGLTLSFGLTGSRCDQRLVRRAIAIDDVVIGTVLEFDRLLERRTNTHEELHGALRLSSLQNCAVTLGRSGVLVKWRGTVWGRFPAKSVVVRNTLGAGDVFAAVMIAEILKRRSISTALRLGTSAAGGSVARNSWVE